MSQERRLGPDVEEYIMKKLDKIEEQQVRIREDIASLKVWAWISRTVIGAVIGILATLGWKH